MVYFVYTDETASSNLGNSLKELLCLEEIEELNGFRRFSASYIKMLEIKGRLVDADYIDNIVKDTIIFLSRHTSGKGIPAFTVHATGNWTEDTTLGGRPRQLSVSSPKEMLSVLSSISSINATGIEVTYEATHHGPFTSNPSFFVELGGNEETIANKGHAQLISNAIVNSLNLECAYGKIAVGIGGTHYSDKFTRLALEGRYAFSHIMPRYNANNVEMLKQAFERSNPKAEIAVLEWKGLKAAERQTIIGGLNSLGIDYAKV